MSSADCINYAGLVKILGKLFKRKLGPLPDTLQAGACIFPLYARIIPLYFPTLRTYHTPSSCLRVNIGYVLVILFQVCSLYVPTKTGHLYGAISGIL